MEMVKDDLIIFPWYGVNIDDEALTLLHHHKGGGGATWRQIAYLGHFIILVHTILFKISITLIYFILFLFITLKNKTISTGNLIYLNKMI